MNISREDRGVRFNIIGSTTEFNCGTFDLAGQGQSFTSGLTRVGSLIPDSQSGVCSKLS